ncbi:MATE family efflux transporter [Desulfoluna limicola]|uniref:MATE family efflux transporter n=1 Tax=Desulfoluna limicola TaxID=2810562 RepID=A0ABN6FA01_9BACT|nr:MATE family efflux transporter [Desulfoluna limicola]BCS99164.1 MATE family efflux transporter [Desulfoluna limicola]
MTEKDIANQFSRYVIPSMMSMVLVGMYMIVDGYFLCRAMGDDGLTAINLAWPMVALMTAIGTGIGTGGSIIMTIRGSGGDEEGALRAKSSTLVLLLGISVLLIPVYYFLVGDALSLLGARGKIHEYGYNYMLVITFGAVFQVMGAGLVPVIKNIGMPVYSMVMMVVGMVINIALDAYFMLGLGLGLEGIAWATCIAQAVVAAMGIGPVLKSKLGPKWYLLERKTTAELIKIGMSPFGLTMAPAIVIVFTNYQCLRYGGNAAVAVYTVMSYAAYFIYSIMQGLADGVQPLISHCTGAKDHKGLGGVLRKGLALGLALGGSFMAVFYLARYQFPIVYGVSHDVAIQCMPAMVAVAVSAPFVVVARLMSACFYAMDDGRNASILVYADPFIFTPFFLVTLPMVMGVKGIWFAYPATQVALTALALVLKSMGGGVQRTYMPNPL